jgi:hypothetical protein
MSNKTLIKREPSHKPLEHPRVNLDFNELQTSTGNLREQVSVRKEQDRILAMLDKDQKETKASYIPIDRVRRFIRGG